VAGDGPRAELLRRTVHWLMQEPDLAEDRLDLRAGGQRIEITARGINPPSQAQLTAPDGSTRTVALASRGDSAATAIEVQADGLYRVDAGGLRRFVLAGDVAELAEVRPRAEPLARLAQASGGSVFRLSDGFPGIRRVDPGERTEGGRLALVRNEGGQLTGVREFPLLPPWAAWGLLAALLAFAWWRERA
jgi:hypothetical protein